jgi:ABC-type lipoprotein release transport system permease subunit
MRSPRSPPSSSPPEGEPILPPILLGRELANQLGVGLGDPVQIVTPVGRITPQGVVPGLLVVRVAGVFFTGIYDYDRKHVYLPLPQAQAFQRAGCTGHRRSRSHCGTSTRSSAARQPCSPPSATVELVVLDWREQNRDLFSAMFLEKVAMSVALVFVILVAAFGILATNLMSVLEKAPEIAILKTMGSSDRSVARIFALEGLCVGILGTLRGDHDRRRPWPPARHPRSAAARRRFLPGAPADPNYSRGGRDCGLGRVVHRRSVQCLARSRCGPPTPGRRTAAAGRVRPPGRR